MSSVLSPARRSLRDYLPGLEDRANVIGQTGTGKTYLAERLCNQRRYVVALDAKGLLEWPGYLVTDSVAELQELDPVEHPRLIFRPSFQDLNDPVVIEEFFAWCYDRGNCCVYVDEVAAIARAQSFPPHFAGILQRGREKGVVLIGATQRPVAVPTILFSEAEHSYIFYLKMPQDRKRVEEMTGLESERIAELQKHQFYYVRQDAPRPFGPFILSE